MYAEVRQLLQTARTEAELQNVLRSLCEPCGPVLGMDVVWGDGTPRRVMCMVEMADHPGADLLASHCGTTTFGHRLVIFTYEAAGDFAPR